MKNAKNRLEIPIRYRTAYKSRKQAYRTRFKEINGRNPHALSDEDYTPIKFFQETWINILEKSPISPGYLERVDAPLYMAILNYMRKANKGKPGRAPFTWEDLGVIPQGKLMNQLLPHLPVPYDE